MLSFPRISLATSGGDEPSPSRSNESRSIVALGCATLRPCRRVRAGEGCAFGERPQSFRFPPSAILTQVCHHLEKTYLNQHLATSETGKWHYKAPLLRIRGLRRRSCGFLRAGDRCRGRRRSPAGRVSARVALRMCRARPSAQREVAVTRCCPSSTSRRVLAAVDALPAQPAPAARRARR